MAFLTKKTLSDLLYRARLHLSAYVPGVAVPPIVRHERHADIVIEGDLPPRSELNTYFGNIEIRGKVGRECCLTSVFGEIIIDGGVGADSALSSSHRSVMIGRNGRGDIAIGVSVHSNHGNVLITGTRPKETSVTSRFGYVVLGEEALERFNTMNASREPAKDSIAAPVTVLAPSTEASPLARALTEENGIGSGQVIMLQTHLRQAAALPSEEAVPNDGLTPASVQIIALRPLVRDTQGAPVNDGP
jgi:hypothetical protein